MIEENLNISILPIIIVKTSLLEEPCFCIDNHKSIWVRHGDLPVPI